MKTNAESKEPKVMNQLIFGLKNQIKINKKIFLAGGFNSSTDTKLEAMGGSPVLKKKSVAKLIEIREGSELCEIWII